MPLFDYQCTACGRTFEQLVRGRTEVACPSCGERKVRKLLAVPAPPVSGGAAAPSCGDSAPPGGCCGGGACQLN